MMCHSRGQLRTLSVTFWKCVTLCLLLTMAEVTFSAKPGSVHLTYGDKLGDYNVLWTTHDPSHSVEEGIVTYGETVFHLENVSTAERLSDGPRSNQFLARLQNLQPGHNIIYSAKVGDDAASKSYFKVPDPDQQSGLSFLVSRGMTSRGSPIVRRMSEVAQSGKYAGMLWLGNSANTTSAIAAMEPVARFVPCLPTPGKGDEETGRYSQYRFAFTTPGKATWPAPVDRLWYSFDIGPVHFISVNTEVFDDHERDLKTAQHNWLLDDLERANSNRDRQPWIVAFGHEAVYCSDVDMPCSSPNSAVRKGLEDILFQGGVDLVISGAGAGYERSYPVYRQFVHSRNYTSPTAPIYVVAAPGNVNSTTNTSAEWVAREADETFAQSYGKLTVVNESTLVWQFISASDDAILDTFTVHQETHDKFVTISPEENVSTVTKVVVTTTPVTTVSTSTTSASGTETVIGSDATATATTGDNSTSNKTAVEDTHFRKFWRKVKVMVTEHRALVIGLGSGFAFFVLVICTMCVVRYKRRRRVSTRRWERLDCNTKYYQDVKAADDDYDSCDDELHVDGRKPTSKLLNGPSRNSVL